MLTRKQHELLVFLQRRLTADGVCPSFDEMKDALSLASKSGIHRLISGLEERGFIRRLPHRARALEILKLPEDASPGAQPARSRFAATVIKGDFRPALVGNPVEVNVESVSLPLYGKIAAGQPIEAMRDHSNSIEVPASLLRTGDHYALEVSGDSMVEAGILSGDIALVQRCDSAENGSIVVALVDENEVTLKRLRRKGASIALEPANRAYETRIFGPDRVKVQGRMVGLLRKY